MTLKCEYFPLCSGCQIQGVVSSPPIWSEIQNFFNRCAPNVNISLKTKEITHWRCRSKLAVRGSADLPQIGLFKKGSHEVVSIPTCPLHHPAINAAYDKVRTVMIAQKIEPYLEEKETGILRYLQFVVDRKTRLIQLTIVVNRSGRDPLLDSFVKQLYRIGGFHSIWINFQPAQTNRIFGNEWVLMEGEPYLWERVGGVDCAFHPACFGQAHLSMYEEVLKRIREWTQPQKRIIELYAGIGTIGLNLAATAEKVTVVEINPYAAECFHLSRLRLAIDLQTKISMHIAPSEVALPMIAEHEIIIVDPPRKGLDDKVIKNICHSDRASQLIYLSCGPQSFQSDCEKLIANGWKIEHAEGYLFFPGCDHVEILCSFKK